MQQRNSQHENVNYVVWDNQLWATINANNKNVESSKIVGDENE